MVDYYTFVKDLRAAYSGTTYSVRYDPAAFVAPDPLGVSGNIEQGEMIAFDATNNRALRFNRTGANGKFIGISRDSMARAALVYSAWPTRAGEISIFTSGIHELLGTAGETYLNYDAVYMAGTDTTRVTKTAAGGIQVGTIHNPLNISYVGNVRVPVLIDEYTKVQK